MANQVQNHPARFVRRESIHDIELVVGNDAMHMTAAEFAQCVHDLRYRELGPRERRIVGGP